MKTRETKNNKKEMGVDDMHFDTMEKFHQEERERLATMMNLIFNN
jgi:hypothetical protein